MHLLWFNWDRKSDTHEASKTFHEAEEVGVAPDTAGLNGVVVRPDLHGSGPVAHVDVDGVGEGEGAERHNGADKDENFHFGKRC